MKNVFIILLFAPIFIITSCGQRDPNKQIDEGKVDGETYTSQEIGWTIQIPKGWSVTSRNKLEANDKKGKEAIEKVIGEFDISGLKHLVSFQKNLFNTFQSTSEPFTPEYEGEWEENNAKIKKLLYDTYTNQGIKVDTSSSKAVIDGLNFDVFKSTIYGPNGNVILHQELYSRYINGFDFGVNINYNNDEDRRTMLEAWQNSKFKKN